MVSRLECCRSAYAAAATAEAEAMPRPILTRPEAMRRGAGGAVRSSPALPPAGCDGMPGASNQVRMGLADGSIFRI